MSCLIRSDNPEIKQIREQFPHNQANIFGWLLKENPKIPKKFTGCCFCGKGKDNSYSRAIRMVVENNLVHDRYKAPMVRLVSCCENVFPGNNLQICNDCLQLISAHKNKD